MELSTTAKLCIAAIGMVSVVGGFLLAAYCVRWLAHRRECPNAPQTAALPVDTETEHREQTNAVDYWRRENTA